MPQIFEEFFQRAVDSVFPSKGEFEKALRLDKELKMYIGIDPTGPDIHLGHSTNLLLLKLFQEMGHKIILLVGDFTARIGDPSGRTTARKPLTEAEIKRNITTYKKQVSKILKFSGSNPAEFRFNSQWLDKLTPQEIIKLAANTTIQQLIERDMFQKRIKEGKPISVHEFLYPLFQGYDSVAMDVDVEVGGTDQTFNMLVGRELLKNYKNKKKFVVTTKLLINPKTDRKLMSKSEGTYISLREEPNGMYGKAMALPDEVVFECFNLCTLLPNAEIQKIQKLKMVEAKKRLAFELVKMYYSEKIAQSAQAYFTHTFQQRKTPTEAPTFRPKAKTYGITDLLVEANLAKSKSEAKRLVEQGAVDVNHAKITNPQTAVTTKEGTIIRVGKSKFIQIGKQK